SQPSEGGAGTLFQRLVVVELGLVVEGGAVGAAGGLGVPHLLVHLADVVLAPRPPLGEGVAGVRDGDAVVADGLVPRPQRLVGAAGAVGGLGAVDDLGLGVTEDGLDRPHGVLVAAAVVEVLAEEERPLVVAQGPFEEAGGPALRRAVGVVVAVGLDAAVVGEGAVAVAGHLAGEAEIGRAH